MKYLIAILLGFFLHKGLEEVYDYHFNKGFMVCGDQYALDIKDDKIDAPLTKRFQCTYKDMGYVADLKYVLMRPHWADVSNERWYY